MLGWKIVGCGIQMLFHDRYIAKCLSLKTKLLHTGYIDEDSPAIQSSDLLQLTLFIHGLRNQEWFVRPVGQKNQDKF